MPVAFQSTIFRREDAGANKSKRNLFYSNQKVLRVQMFLPIIMEKKPRRLNKLF